MKIDLGPVGAILRFCIIGKKKIYLTIGVISFIIIFSKLLSSRHKEIVISAVACKSHFVPDVIPDSRKRDDYLSPLGSNYLEIENDLFYYISTQTYNCKDQVHIGPSEDGGWEVCLEDRFNIKSPCLVYSFGVGNDFRFENGIQDLLQCEVHAFDPSMDTEDFQFSPTGFFHNYGISSANKLSDTGNWRLKTLSEIMKELDHRGRSIDVLKMDIEFSEWPALYHMISSGIVKSVRQLVMEIHTPEMDIHTHPDNKCTWTTIESLAFMMRTLIDLKNLQFQVFHSRINYRTKFISPITNQERYCCHNLHLVNMNHPMNKWLGA